MLRKPFIQVDFERVYRVSELLQAFFHDDKLSHMVLCYTESHVRNHSKSQGLVMICFQLCKLIMQTYISFPSRGCVV